MNKKCDAFLKRFPLSKFNKFVRTDLRVVYAPSNWGAGYDLVGGYSQNSGSYAEYFKTDVVFGTGIFTTYKKMAIRGELVLAGSTSRKYFSENGNWEKGEYFTLLYYGLNLGYELFEDNKFRLESHVKFGGSRLDYASSEDEDAKDETVLSSAITPGVGFTLLYMLIQPKRVDDEHVWNKGYIYVSFTCDYSYKMFGLNYDDYSGGTLNVNLGLGLYYRSIKRDI